MTPNVSAWALLWPAVATVLVALASMIGVIFSSRRASSAAEKTARITTDGNKDIHLHDGRITIAAKLVEDRNEWEKRLLDVQKNTDDRVERMEKKLETVEISLDKERAERRKLETDLHAANLIIKTLQDQHERAARELDLYRIERIKRNQDYQEEITRLHDENLRLHEEIRVLRGDYEKLQASYNNLDAQINNPKIG